MDEITSRNFPNLPKTGSAGFPEISRAPYKGGEKTGGIHVGSIPDLFGLKQKRPQINDRFKASLLVKALKTLNTHPAVA